MSKNKSIVVYGKVSITWVQRHLLRPQLQGDPMRLGSHQPIIPEVVAEIGIRYLGGSKMTEFNETLTVSYPSAWRLTNKFLDAVLLCDALSFGLPTSPEALQHCAKEFDSISTAEGVFYGVVGALDGWLCCINKPKDVSNPLDFFQVTTSDSDSMFRLWLTAIFVSFTFLLLVLGDEMMPRRSKPVRHFRSGYRICLLRTALLLTMLILCKTTFWFHFRGGKRMKSFIASSMFIFHNNEFGWKWHLVDWLPCGKFFDVILMWDLPNVATNRSGMSFA